MIKKLPLKEKSIAQVYSSDKATYEVPIYQRNYAWEKNEIATLVQDVFDAFASSRQTYYVGTLVTFCKDKSEQVHEVIDGQQRLTTINLILHVLGVKMQNKLTYRARKKSNDTLKSIPSFDADEMDIGIKNGYKFAEKALEDIVAKSDRQAFTEYFLNNVSLVHYQVPKDVDLNNYFEIMNSRGEQLEKHEIVKARLVEVLNEEDRAKFSNIWESCSDMGVYIQQKYPEPDVFGDNLDDFIIKSFDDLPEDDDVAGKATIYELIERNGSGKQRDIKDRIDTFQPILDFANFLLIVLKITRIVNEDDFDPTTFNLDDKELLKEFGKVKEKLDKDFVKQFGFNLLQAKYFLDNYIVHHSNEEDTMASNPWKLQYWHKEGKKKGYLRNLYENREEQDKMVHLLSMFEVSFSAKQRKNYLFYCLLYWFTAESWDDKAYYEFVSKLADKYFYDVYMDQDRLSEINVPIPGSFDTCILPNNELDVEIYNAECDFTGIYGDGHVPSKGIPQFIFNYLDYKIWDEYYKKLQGKSKLRKMARIDFFKSLGCSDFSLDVFEHFYFSRTRGSLEHFYPRANANGKNGSLTQDQIECFGNYAMIGSDANSSGSNWTPKAKLIHYLDESNKIKYVSVASLKFRIMMQACKDNESVRPTGEEWNHGDILKHQENMLNILEVQ